VKKYAGRGFTGLLTWTLKGGEWSVSLLGLFIPNKDPPTPFGYEVELAPQPLWKLRRREKISLAGKRITIP